MKYIILFLLSIKCFSDSYYLETIGMKDKIQIYYPFIKVEISTNWITMHPYWSGIVYSNLTTEIIYQNVTNKIILQTNRYAIYRKIELVPTTIDILEKY